MCDDFFSQSKLKILNDAGERRGKAKEKKQKSVEKAIPSITDSIKTVVSLSRNDEFKMKCLALFEAKNDDELCEALKKKLWKIASCRLNVNSNEQESNKQLAQECETLTDKTKKKVAGQINMPEKGGGEDYFDDLANETSFYEGEDKISHEEHKITGLIDLENEVPFEILTELNWDLSEENSESKSCIRNDKVAYNRKDQTPCCSNGQETQYSVNPSQKLQWSLEKRDKVSPVTTSTAKTASPKAKSRCHKLESTLTQENENTSNDWLQDISLDCFGFSSSHAHENMGSKQSLSLSSKVRVKECEMVSPLEKSSSQCKKTSDDFDDLAEEW